MFLARVFGQASGWAIIFWLNQVFSSAYAPSTPSLPQASTKVMYAAAEEPIEAISRSLAIAYPLQTLAYNSHQALAFGEAVLQFR